MISEKDLRGHVNFPILHMKSVTEAWNSWDLSQCFNNMAVFYILCPSVASSSKKAMWFWAKFYLVQCLLSFGWDEYKCKPWCKLPVGYILVRKLAKFCGHQHLHSITLLCIWNNCNQVKIIRNEKITFVSNMWMGSFKRLVDLVCIYIATEEEWPLKILHFWLAENLHQVSWKLWWQLL